MNGHEQLKYLEKADWKRRWAAFSMVGTVLFSFGLVKIINYFLPFVDWFNGVLLILIGGALFLVGQNRYYDKIFFPDNVK